jgi:hypothetical protein
MATFQKFNAFSEHLAEGVHNFSSDATCTITVALCATANAPTASNSVLGDLTQIAYTNLSSRVVAVSTSAQTSGTYKLVLNDLVLTASGGSVAAFQYVVLYNDDPTSPADPLIAFFDYGSAVTLNDGETLTLDFDGTNGLFTIAFA